MLKVETDRSFGFGFGFGQVSAKKPVSVEVPVSAANWAKLSAWPTHTIVRSRDMSGCSRAIASYPYAFHHVT
ncbi:unnamed protein product [Acanthoscelides obtectus]|uniref:Uncharacterized protein n=1 Tax=Acanthoscelides obtectus TaxID=200917 RepID=A0A9P0L5L0_ACAOB|nr:unnamed protein product [Acanthoscelides obtectus]CAK1666408.1 hypothetical protein AOBTE_LOCUS25312 [Acanthoscelides obtectus]